MWNYATQLTLFRIVVIPLMVIVYYWNFKFNGFAAAALFSIAGITDWADGYVARKYNLTTRFGAFLDPVADKLMVACALAVLIETHNDLWFTIPAIVIISREIVISALREWMAELGARATVAVSSIGKIKTTMQIVAIIVLLAFHPDEYPVLNTIGYYALYIAAVLTLWSMIMYIRAAWPSLSAEDS